VRSREIATFWRYIAGSLDRLVGILDGLGEQELNWCPPAEATNSLYTLAFHTLANAEENILGTLCGQPTERHREDEFTRCVTQATSLQDHWRDLRIRLEVALSALPSTELDAARTHPRRGQVEGRDILIIVARHAAEHLGQAELTRDLMNAASRKESPR